MDNTKSWVWIASLTFFMQSLDTTMLYLAAPAIAEALQLKLSTIELVVVCYILTVVIFTPISSWIIDKYGEQKTYQCAVLLFALGSSFCFLSSSVTSLVLWRIVQGFGGALMLPASRIMILKRVSSEKKIKYLNQITILGLCGPIVGPLLAGWCITTLSWQFIFMINIPICLLCTCLASKTSTCSVLTKLDFDLQGYMLIAPALLLLMCGLMGVGNQFLSLSKTFILFSCAILFFILYWSHHKKSKRPLFVLSLLRIPTFSISIVSSMALRTFLSSIPLILSLMMQTLFDFAPKPVAVTMLSVAIGAMFSKIVVERTLGFLGFRNLLIIFTLIVSAVVFSLRTLTAESPMGLFSLLAFILGMLSNLLFSVINFLSFSELAANTYNAGNSLLTLTQLIAIMLSITLSFTILKFASQSSGVYSLESYHTLLLFMSVGIALCSFIFVPLKKSEVAQNSR